MYYCMMTSLTTTEVWGGPQHFLFEKGYIDVESYI